MKWSNYMKNECLLFNDKCFKAVFKRMYSIILLCTSFHHMVGFFMRVTSYEDVKNIPSENRLRNGSFLYFCTCNLIKFN
jgi:hypothetical protein